MNLKKLVSIGLCFFIITSILPISFANAATVAVTVTPSTIADGDNSTNKVVSFIPSTVLINQSKLYVYYPSSYTDTSLVAGDVTVIKTGDANYTSASTSVDTTNNVLTITLTTGGNLDTTNAFTVTIAAAKLVSSSTGGVNYSFGIATDNLSGSGDVGATLQYVGTLNKVQVTAIVPPVLTFAIRNTADSAEQATAGTQKVCNLGVMSLTAVASCSYRLKVSTNANGGYSVSYNSDTRLTNGTVNFTDSAIGGVGTTIAAGTEMYGAILTPGSATSGGAVTRSATKFGSSAGTSYRITEAAGPYTVYTSASFNAPSGTDTTNTALMNHQAAISGSTPTGSYSHIVTYTVAATF